MCISSQLKLNSKTDVSHFGFYGIFFVAFLFKTWKIYHSDKLKFSGGLNPLMDHGVGGREGAVLVHQDHGPIKTFVNHREIIFDPPAPPLSLALIVFFQ